MTVTNGTIEYSRTVRPADFESISAKVVLSFAVEEGSDPAVVVAKVHDIAVAEVHRRVGLSKPKAVGSSAAKPSIAPVENPTVAAPVASTKPEPSAEANATISPDPASIVEPETVPEAEPTPVTITDKELHSAVNLAVEKKVPAQAIRKLTAEFTGEVGKSMTLIPQEARQAFLAKLKELYVNA